MDLKNSLLFPAVQSVHLVGIAMLVGTIILRNAYLLMNSDPPFGEQLAPWTRRGLILMLITGPVLFLADAARYLHNPAFLVKMAILASALWIHFLRRSPSRTAAILSIGLWTGVVLAGRAIADFDL
jgi:hypothetical protein